MDRSTRAIWLMAGVLLLLACADWQAHAQQPGQAVTTSPSVANSGEGSGTIASSDVFQLVFAATNNGVGTGAIRRGCLVQNTSGHVQYVYFQGPGMTVPTSANSSTLEGKAIGLDPSQVSGGKQGGSVSCATGAGSALQDAIWIAGTSGDAFVAKQQ